MKLEELIEASPKDKVENLYLSKISNLDECKRKYYFIYKLHLSSKEEPKPFRIGRIFHSIAEATLKGTDVMRPLDRCEVVEREMILDLLNAKNKDSNQDFLQHLSNIKDTLISSESAITFPIDNDYNWVIKTDAIHNERDNIETWMDEFKTASGHGAATASFYHNSPQTWTYLYNLDSIYPKLKGVKFYIVTKTKTPTLHIETVFKDALRLDQARKLIEGAIESLNAAKASGKYPRSGTKCKTIFSECEFYKLCYLIDPIKKTLESNVRTSYVEEILDLYVKKDPEDHLWKASA